MCVARWWLKVLKNTQAYRVIHARLLERNLANMRAQFFLIMSAHFCLDRETFDAALCVSTSLSGKECGVEIEKKKKTKIRGNSSWVHWAGTQPSGDIRERNQAGSGEENRERHRNRSRQESAFRRRGTGQGVASAEDGLARRDEWP